MRSSFFLKTSLLAIRFAKFHQSGSAVLLDNSIMRYAPKFFNTVSIDLTANDPLYAQSATPAGKFKHVRTLFTV